MKGRVSQYDNSISTRSQAIIDRLIQKTTRLTIADIEKFQLTYGISNKDLSHLSGHSPTQISDFKAEKIPMPDRVKQHLFLILKEFEAHF